MKTNFLRAGLAASFSLFVAGALMAVPCHAADAAKPPPISKALAKPLSEANKALNAKDYTTALAKLKEAQAVSDRTDYDNYIINYYLGVVYVNTNDHPDATTAFLAAAQSTTAPLDQQHASAMHLAIQLENEAKNYAKIIELAQLAIKNNELDNNSTAILAFAYFNTNDYANAMSTAHKAIDLNNAAGKVPERGLYQVLMNSQVLTKDMPSAVKTLETMANIYGNPEDWGRLIDAIVNSLSTPTKSNRETAALYIYRLRLVTGAESAADDYLMMADLAMGQNSPGDALQALHTGINSGKLSPAKAAADLAKANARAKGDEAALPAAEALAAKKATADSDVSVAEGYYGYGRYADAARVAQRAIAKGGPKLTRATLLLGISQARAGDPAAAATLAQVKGDPAFERAAELWTLYVTRKYGTAAPAAGH